MKRAQRGFALIAAIVLVVTLAALAGFVVSMTSGQAADQQLERLSRVADQAAQAGLEWGGYRVLRPAAAPACFGPTTLNLPGSLAATPVRVTCVRTNTTEAGAPLSAYQITATATRGPLAAPDFVERTRSGVFTR